MDRTDDQDHLVDLAHHRGAGQVSTTVAARRRDHQGLVSCADRVAPATTAVDDARLKLQDHHLAMILNQQWPTTRSAWERDSAK
jgi:hypothetical protein